MIADPKDLEENLLCHGWGFNYTRPPEELDSKEAAIVFARRLMHAASILCAACAKTGGVVHGLSEDMLGGLSALVDYLEGRQPVFDDCTASRMGEFVTFLREASRHPDGFMEKGSVESEEVFELLEATLEGRKVRS